VLPPFYYQGVSDDGLFAWFSEVIQRTGGTTKVYLYHFPQQSALPFSHDLIGRLLKAGRKVAICDQTEEAKPGKLVQREVTSILSPGTHFDDRLLRAERNNFLASIALHGDTYGLACVDLTTGDFRLTELSDSKPLLAELERLRPAELIFPGGSKALSELLGHASTQLSPHDDWVFLPETAMFTLREHFKVA
jgi:DNA mismatch repair protein MutS